MSFVILISISISISISSRPFSFTIHHVIVILDLSMIRLETITKYHSLKIDVGVVRQSLMSHVSHARVTSQSIESSQLSESRVQIEAYRATKHHYSLFNDPHNTQNKVVGLNVVLLQDFKNSIAPAAFWHSASHCKEPLERAIKRGRVRQNAAGSQYPSSSASSSLELSRHRRGFTARYWKA